MGILTDKNIYFRLNIGYIGNLLLIIIFLIIVYLLFNERKNKQRLASEQEILYNYIIKYEKELVEKSKIIHDFKNQLVTIKGFTSEKDVKLNQYLSELVDDIKKKDIITLKELGKIPVGGLKGLLYYKFAGIENLGIDLTLNINKSLSKIEKISLQTYKNIIKIIGVYLDNAIEATVKSKKKKIEVEIYENNKTINFIISNTYSNHIDLSKLGNAGYSSKGKDRGYGLSFVQDILRENKGFFESRNISNDIYTVSLSVKI
jgi:two-component system sensor histidine kinase AgrC